MIWSGHVSGDMVASCVDEMVCLGVSENNGSPYHPLMQPASAPLIPWSPT